MNAHASDATIVFTFNSQVSHVIQVHKYYTKWETFRFTLPALNLLTQENESRAFSCGLDQAFNTKFKGSLDTQQPGTVFKKLDTW